MIESGTSTRDNLNLTSVSLTTMNQLSPFGRIFLLEKLFRLHTKVALTITWESIWFKTTSIRIM